jgi:hypothetical protein
VIRKALLRSNRVGTLIINPAGSALACCAMVLAISKKAGMGECQRAPARYSCSLYRAANVRDESPIRLHQHSQIGSESGARLQ